MLRLVVPIRVEIDENLAPDNKGYIKWGCQHPRARSPRDRSSGDNLNMMEALFAPFCLLIRKEGVTSPVMDVQPPESIDLPVCTANAEGKDGSEFPVFSIDASSRGFLRKRSHALTYQAVSSKLWHRSYESCAVDFTGVVHLPSDAAYSLRYQKPVGSTYIQ